MTPLLVSHLLAALIALPLGGYQLFRPTKGDARHVLLGRVWVALMIGVALSSYGIRTSGTVGSRSCTSSRRSRW